MATPIKYVAELSHVREVTLLGHADLAYWADRLNREALEPIARDGFAQVMVVAADSKYMGVKFREVSFSVLASGRHDGRAQQGARLLQAFNSSRFFAFCERTFFSTPYVHAHVAAAATPPSSIDVKMNGNTIFRAAMRDEQAPRMPLLSAGQDSWNGPVFLPVHRRPKLFYVRLEGATRRYPFDSSRDDMTAASAPRVEALQALYESSFSPTEWHLREDARHAKSKTYARELN